MRDSVGEKAPPLRPRFVPAVDESNQPRKLYPLFVGSGNVSGVPTEKVSVVGSTMPPIGL